MNTCPKCQKAEPYAPCRCGKCRPVILEPGNMIVCCHCRELLILEADQTFTVATLEQRREAFSEVMEELLGSFLSPARPTVTFGRN